LVTISIKALALIALHSFIHSFIHSLNYYLPDCGAMSDPTDGDVDLSNGTVYKSAAAFTCRHGFQLIGMNVLRCLANGSWDHVPPVCVIYGR